VEIARGYAELGFTITATSGTSAFLRKGGIEVTPVLKHYEGRPSIIDMIKNNEIQLVINTPLGETARYDEYIMGQTAMRYKVPFLTTLAAASAALSGITAQKNEQPTCRSIQEYYLD
jgi:carbamoyl-phosphate synthase large subunit